MGGGNRNASKLLPPINLMIFTSRFCYFFRPDKWITHTHEHIHIPTHVILKWYLRTTSSDFESDIIFASSSAIIVIMIIVPGKDAKMSTTIGAFNKALERGILWPARVSSACVSVENVWKRHGRACYSAYGFIIMCLVYAQ